MHRLPFTCFVICMDYNRNQKTQKTTYKALTAAVYCKAKICRRRHSLQYGYGEPFPYRTINSADYAFRIYQTFPRHSALCILHYNNKKRLPKQPLLLLLLLSVGSVEILELEKVCVSFLSNLFTLCEECFSSVGEFTHKSCVTGFVLDECLIFCVGSL